MHIPDGMLDTRTWASAWAGSATAIGFAVREVRRRMDDSTLVLMAVLAALVFALQMLNFPVAGGTSGHFSGGAAAAIILGPWPAVLVMAAVLIVQSLFFADGGITALGANILTMGIIGPFAGWWLYTLVTRGAASRSRKAAAAFIAAWAGTFAAALAVASLLWISGRVPLLPGLAAMGFWHALIGIGEGVITAGLVSYLLGVRPDLLAGEQPREAASVRPVAVTLGIVAALAAGLSFLASVRPDGLEFVYFEKGLGAKFAGKALVQSPMPDYLLPGIANETLAGILAGIVGLVLTGVLLYAGVKTLRGR
ncbi:MAG TPA: energy-coupling factor ABC transporter permease, partial [Coriobacteriia bacterium]|nr:energy-coupling factor ABC transporter permease [Coriobacteriia bacterium]